MKRTLLLLSTLSIVTLLFLILFSYTTSPLYNCLISDSANYVAMGKFWKDGNIPYLDFFDHKGPLIFFIEMVGNIVIDGKCGVLIIQWISLVITLFGIFKISTLFLPLKKSFFITLLSLFILNTFYDGGNFTEEYCNIFITWSLYFIIRYLIKWEADNSIKHSVWNSFFYGIAFMFCVLIRITNALPICCFVLIGIIALAKDKKYREIFKNALFFIGGGVALAVPFIVYFILHNTFSDMIYATFIHNFIYASSTSNDGLELVEHVKQLGYSLPLFAVIGIGIFGLIYRKENRYIYYSIVFSSVCGLILWYTSRPYPHYLIIWLPVLALALTILWKEFKIQAKMKYILLYLSGFLLLFIPVKNLLVIHECVQIYNDDSFSKKVQNAEVLKKYIKSDSVLAYNLEASIYVETDLNPACRLFTMQDWICSFNEKLENEFEDCISQQKAEYILIGTSSENKENDLIYQYYNAVAQDEQLILLRKK